MSKPSARGVANTTGQLLYFRVSVQHLSVTCDKYVVYTCSSAWTRWGWL